MNIVEVNSRREAKQFHDVGRVIYRNDNTWVCPLDKEIESIFNPTGNIFFQHGEATRWILFDDQKKLAGRIAAFIDHKSSLQHDQPTGGIGFFESVNNIKASNRLFDTAKSWLTERGMKAMDGPINFGEPDKYWGLLVNGFTHPSYEITYNHKYYSELFEAYGFKTYFKQEGFHLDIKKEMPERFRKIAEWITRKPEYEYRHFKWKESDRFVDDFAAVYNEAWASFKENFEPMDTAYIKKTLKKAKAIIDEEFIWFAYFEGKPIALYIMFPDLNQILKHLNGKLNPLSMIKFLYLKKRKTMTRAKGLLMGVIPKYQGMGIESAFILHIKKVFDRKPHYQEIEFSWVADFNPKMRKIFISVGSVPAKNYITYRYLFDRTKEFVRYPIPDMK